MTTTSKEMWRFCAALFRGSRWQIALCVGLSVLQALTVLPSALLVRHVFDRSLPAKDPRGLVWAGIGIAAAVLLNTVLALIARTQTLRVVKRVVSRLREHLSDRLLMLPRAFYTRSDHGAVHATIVQDTERLDVMCSDIVNQVFPAIVLTLGLTVMLAWLNWMLLIVMLTVWPLSFAISRGLRARVRARVGKFRSAFEHYSQVVLRLLQSIDLVRMQSAEKIESHRQVHAIETLQRDSLSVARESATHNAVQQALLTLSAMVILLFGGWLVMLGKLTIGSLLSFYVAARSLNTAQTVLLNATPRLIAGRESLEALWRLLGRARTESEQLPYPSRSGKALEFNGNIEFQDVTFSYNARDGKGDTDALVLKDLNFSSEQGKTSAIVGANGAGKSTLIYLLIGFYRPYSGQLLADGHPYDSLDLSNLGRQIGVVPQNPFFFSGTIQENLIYGYDSVDPRRLNEAISMAAAAEFIEALPEGLDTQIGDGGAMLSGGERQRLALARALLRKPKLLVLDEPTNHLDHRAVEEVVAQLAALKPAPTLLLISHDDEVVARLCPPSRIHLLQGGRIITKATNEKEEKARNELASTSFA